MSRPRDALLALEITDPTTGRGTVRLAGRIAGALVVAVVVIGLLVSLTCAAQARRWLGYQFVGLPARPGEAAAILGHNLRALAAVGGLLLVAQSPYWAEQGPGLAHRVLQRAGEVLLAAAVAANLLIVGASVGAYGIRMVRAMLPHGPGSWRPTR